MQARSAKWATVCVSVLAGFSCAGQQPPPTMKPRETEAFARTPSIYAHGDLGIGAPEGLVGGGLGFEPVRWCSFELGGGMSDAGPQVAAMASLRLQVSSRATIGLGSGFSFGRHTETLDDADYQSGEDSSFKVAWSGVGWLNNEMQIRHSTSDSTVVRFHAGVAVPVISNTPSCGVPKACEELKPLPTLVPYFGIGLEQAF